MKVMKWDDRDKGDDGGDGGDEDDGDDGDDRDDGDNGGSVECVLAKDVEVNKLGVWLLGRLLNVSLIMCKGIEACLTLILLFVESECGKVGGGS
jgi:hypothetical protein